MSALPRIAMMSDLADLAKMAQPKTTVQRAAYAVLAHQIFHHAFKDTLKARLKLCWLNLHSCAG